MEKKLSTEAYALWQSLNLAAYHHAARYTKGYSYNPAYETDAHLTRLNRIVGRAYRRIARRVMKARIVAD